MQNLDLLSVSLISQLGPCCTYLISSFHDEMLWKRSKIKTVVKMSYLSIHKVSSLQFVCNRTAKQNEQKLCLERYVSGAVNVGGLLSVCFVWTCENIEHICIYTPMYSVLQRKNVIWTSSKSLCHWEVVGKITFSSQHLLTLGKPQH